MTSPRWFIATNTDNLKFFYDCGLIVDRQAFPNNSYMHDMQAERPKGFLPCLSEDNLSEALKLAKREDENLIACLVEIELKNIRFEHFFVKSRKMGEFESVDREGFTLIDDVEILLPSPLPLSCIKNIFLSDAKNQKRLVQEFTLTFGEFSKDFFKSDAKLFKALKPCNESTPEFQSFQSETDRYRETVQLKDIPDHGLDYKKVFAYGNALFLGFYQTKNGRLSSELFEAFASNKLEEDKYHHLHPLASWVFDNQNESKLALFYSLVFDLIVAEDELGTVHYELLKLFENKTQLPPEYAHVSGLAIRLRQILERTYEDTIDAYFSKLIKTSSSNEIWSSKIFLLISMIFIRDHSETLLKFYHEQFTEEDYFLLAVFFGLIKGIRTTPKEIKNIAGLRNWVSFKMAELMHQSNSAAIVFEKEPSLPALIHKRYLKKSSVPKIQDALQKFCSHIKVDEAEVIAWKLVPKDEYKVNSGAITFSKRPSLYAEVDNKHLENLMLVKSIKETDELFDFNAVFKIFKD